MYEFLPEDASDDFVDGWEARHLYGFLTVDDFCGEIDSVAHKEWLKGWHYQPTPCKIEDACIVSTVGEQPLLSVHGYIIDNIGTVYTLTNGRSHGALLSLLYPEISRELGYVVPFGNFDKTRMTTYESFARNAKKNGFILDCIRISRGLTQYYVEKSSGWIITPEQQRSLVACFKTMNFKLNDVIHTNYGTVTVRKLLTLLIDEK